jgi:hypothetical protein
MTKPRLFLSVVPLAAALLVAPGVAAADAPGPAAKLPPLPSTSLPQSFWFGDEIPASQAQAIHDALTTPDGGVIRKLEDAIEADDGNPEKAKGLVRYVPDKVEPGVTLLSTLTAVTPNGSGGYHRTVVLVDMEGKELKRWAPLQGFPAKMLPGGSVMGYRDAGLAGHQDNGSLVQLSWCGALEWSFGGATEPEGLARVHHDYQREGNPVGYPAPGAFANPNGYAAKTWLLVHREPDAAKTGHITTNYALEDDSVIEVDANGDIAWQWNAWEHFAEFGFDLVAKQGIQNVQVPVPESLGGGFPESDWQHVNAVSLLGPNKWYEGGDERFHPDNLIMDGRSTNIIWIVARHDHPQGLWKSGAIVWKTGPDYGVGQLESRIGQIIGQHTAHMIPAGLPGAGNILVFDNGGLAGFGSLLPGLPGYWPTKFRGYSRALEFDPVTFEKVWEYTNETDERATGGHRRFMSWFISSVQRLKNGNTLITEGHSGRVFEVSRAGEMVWEFISPYRPTPAYPNLVYRAYRYPLSYLPAQLTCP